MNKDKNNSTSRQLCILSGWPFLFENLSKLFWILSTVPNCQDHYLGFSLLVNDQIIFNNLDPDVDVVRKFPDLRKVNNNFNRFFK
jgi:hypothetical protein